MMALGFLAIIFPVPTLFAAAMIFSSFLIVDGIFALVSGIRGLKERTPHGAQIIIGLMEIAVGLFGILVPVMTMLSFVYLVAAWALARGVLDIVGAVALRKVIQREWMLMLSGIFSIAFSIFISRAPAPGMVVLAWMTGFYALITGGLLISLGLRIRREEENWRAGIFRIVPKVA